MRRNFVIGDQVGPYRLDRALGGGGFGEVWQASSDQGVVALKLLHGHTDPASDSYQMFRRERDAAGRVNSGRVARLFDSDLQGDVPFLAFQLIPGATLQDFVARQPGGKLSLAETLAIFTDVATGLRDIHSAGIWHRDIKPSNVIVVPNGGAVIVDLGVAVLGEGSDITRAGWGTDGYRAPEQLLGVPRSAALDVWSLGATLVKAATGHLPFVPIADVLRFDAQLGDRPDLTGLPAPLFDLALDCLAYDAEARPTAEEVGSRLAALASEDDEAVRRRRAGVVVEVERVEPAFVRGWLVPELTVRGADSVQWLSADWDYSKTPEAGEWAVVPTSAFGKSRVAGMFGAEVVDPRPRIRPLPSGNRVKRLHADAPRNCPACGRATERDLASLRCSEPAQCPGHQVDRIDGALQLAQGNHVGLVDWAMRRSAHVMVSEGASDLMAVLAASAELLSRADEAGGGALLTAIETIRRRSPSDLVDALVPNMYGLGPFPVLREWAHVAREDSSGERLQRLLTRVGGQEFARQVEMTLRLHRGDLGEKLHRLRGAVLFVEEWHPRGAEGSP